MESHHNHQTIEVDHSVSRGELNSWRRGFTPQAEIWNGRMAMFGLFIGISFLFLIFIIIFGLIYMVILKPQIEKRR